MKAPPRNSSVDQLAKIFRVQQTETSVLLMVATDCLANIDLASPEIEYVLKTRESDARPAVSALGNLVQEMAAKISTGAEKEKIRGLRQSLRR
jgi:hypothetical protein